MAASHGAGTDDVIDLADEDSEVLVAPLSSATFAHPALENLKSSSSHWSCSRPDALAAALPVLVRSSEADVMEVWNALGSQLLQCSAWCESN